MTVLSLSSSDASAIKILVTSLVCLPSWGAGSFYRHPETNDNTSIYLSIYLAISLSIYIDMYMYVYAAYTPLASARDV